MSLGSNLLKFLQTGPPMADLMKPRLRLLALEMGACLTSSSESLELPPGPQASASPSLGLAQSSPGALVSGGPGPGSVPAA